MLKGTGNFSLWQHLWSKHPSSSEAQEASTVYKKELRKQGRRAPPAPPPTEAKKPKPPTPPAPPSRQVEKKNKEADKEKKVEKIRPYGHDDCSTDAEQIESERSAGSSGARGDMLSQFFATTKFLAKHVSKL